MCGLQMSAIEPNWTSLFIFIPAWLLGCAGLIHLSASLPPSAAAPPLRSTTGKILIWLNLIVLTGLCVLALGFAFDQLRLTSLIIAAGFVFLFSPLAVQDLPQSFQGSQLSLVLLLGLGAFGLVLLSLAF